MSQTEVFLFEWLPHHSAPLPPPPPRLSLRISSDPLWGSMDIFWNCTLSAQPNCLPQPLRAYQDLEIFSITSQSSLFKLIMCRIHENNLCKSDKVTPYQFSKNLFQFFQEDCQFFKALKCVSTFFCRICTAPFLCGVKPSFYIFFTHGHDFHKAPFPFN